MDPYGQLFHLMVSVIPSFWFTTSYFEYIGTSAAIKTIDVGSRTGGGEFDRFTLVESFQKEITMAYKMRKETRHVVTIYGFDFDPRTGLALMAMELGGDSLAKRIKVLHMAKDMKRRRHHNDGTVSRSSDYIPSRERKNIWVQLVNIVQTLHRHRIVSIFDYRVIIIICFTLFYHTGSS